MAASSISRFWDIYINKTKTYNIKPDVVRWYVRHAECYIKFNSGSKLKSDVPEYVEKFLIDKGRLVRADDRHFVENKKLNRPTAQYNSFLL